MVSALLEGVTPLDGGAWNAATRTLSWNLDSLPSGGAARRCASRPRWWSPPRTGPRSATRRGRPAPSSPSSRATIRPRPAANDPTCLTVVSAPDFSATTKTVEDLNGAPTRPGDPLRYSIVVSNDGHRDRHQRERAGPGLDESGQRGARSTAGPGTRPAAPRAGSSPAWRPASSRPCASRRRWSRRSRTAR